MCRKIHGFFPLLAVFSISIGFAEEPPKKLSAEQIDKLIQQLSSSDFDVRESASRQLGEREEALPALRKAAKSADLEVRRRAEEAVARLERRLSERFLRQALAQVNQEGVDLFVDRMVLQKPFAKAGLHKDDRILAVDRTKFLAADVFSKLLRRRVVAGKALLKVQRGDRVLELPVVFDP